MCVICEVTGVGWIWVDLETLVDDSVWCVDVDLSCSDSGSSRARGRVSCLRADIAHRAVHVGVDELGVVLVHDFLVDKGRVFCLLDEEFLEKQQLHAQESSEEDCRDESDRRTRVGRAGR